MITRVSKKEDIYTCIWDSFCEFNRNKTRGDKKRTLYTSKETQTHMYCVFIEWNSAYFSFFCLYGNKKRTILLYYLVGWFLFRLIILCILDRSLLAFFFLLSFSLSLSTRFVDKQATKEWWHPIEEKKQAISFLTSKSVFFSCSSSKSNIQHLLSTWSCLQIFILRHNQNSIWCIKVSIWRDLSTLTFISFFRYSQAMRREFEYD